MRLAPSSLRARLFAGIAVTVLASLAVTVVTGALLSRRSLDRQALSELSRQVDLIAVQRARDGAGPTDALGEFLATEQQRLAVLTSPQAELLLPTAAAAALREGRQATGSLDVGGARFLYAARREGPEALVLLREANRQASDWTPFVLGLALAAVIGAALAAGMALVLARAVSRPVKRAAEAGRQLAAGITPAPLPATGPAEVASLAASFNSLTAELSRAHAAERSFLLSVSHELKTPLTVVRAHAEALADRLLTADAAGPVIEREAMRLERLVQDLLDLARLRQRTFSVRAETVDLGAVARDALDRYERLAAARGLALEAVVEPRATAVADSGRVLQALSNLVENALRCTPGGGRVVVVASAGKLDVVDDGPGLAEADHARAFERFYLHERYGDDRGVGTGLGLAIVAELAAAMGGRASVLSTEGAGSTFTIELPCTPAPRAHGETDAAQLAVR